MVNNIAINVEKECTIMPIEFESLPFIPKRMYIVRDIPATEVRGYHAHKETQQVAICIDGKVRIDLFDGIDTKSHIISKGDSLLIPKLIWDSEVYLTGHDILMFICSTKYSLDDYILDIQEFISIKTGERVN